MGYTGCLCATCREKKENCPVARLKAEGKRIVEGFCLDPDAPSRPPAKCRDCWNVECHTAKGLEDDADLRCFKPKPARPPADPLPGHPSGLEWRQPVKRRR